MRAFAHPASRARYLLPPHCGPITAATPGREAAAMRAIGNGPGFCNLMRAAALMAIASTPAGVSPAAGQESGTRIPVRLDYCPPEKSKVPLLTRQAFDEGRAAEGREYGKLTDELYRISTSDWDDEAILDKSFAAIRIFVQSMQARGHDIDFGDIVVHREAILTSILSSDCQLAPISRAQLELQLAITREMKRRVCPH
jgi:hypothetical protein